MLLTDVLSSLCNEIPLESITREQYRRAIERFGKHLGRPAKVDDLTISTVNAFLIWLTDTYKIGPTSVANYRTSIVRIWMFAHDPLGIAPDCPTRRIRRPKRQQKAVRAWTLEQLDSLLSAAESLTDVLQCGIRASEYFRALVWFAYETGLRPSDLRLLRWSDLDLERRMVAVCQHKTSMPHVAIFGTQSAEALQTLAKYGQDLVFPLRKRATWVWEQKLFKAAQKFGFRRQKREGLGTLRKTHATEVYRTFGLAAASQSLGHHGDITTARRHYVDSSAQRGYLPPAPGR
jgi:integrase